MSPERTQPQCAVLSLTGPYNAGLGEGEGESGWDVGVVPKHLNGERIQMAIETIPVRAIIGEVEAERQAAQVDVSH